MPYEPEPLPLLLDVPLLDPTQTISTGIQALTRMRRSALIVADPDRPPRLLHAVDLYRARSEKTSSIGEMIAASKSGAVGFATLSTLKLNYNAAPGEVFRELSARNVSLALVRELPETGAGMLVVVSQSLFDEITSGPADCYCTGPRKHRFPPPSVQTGDLCPFDGHPIYCKI
jgi:hypothetical protein